MKKLYTELDFKLLEPGKNVYLYGAGTVAKLLFKRLSKYHIAICGFIETRPTAKKLNGLPIKPFEEIKAEENVCVVLATKSRFHQEILDNLTGFDDIYIVTDHLIKIMMMIDNRALQFQTHIVEHCNLNCRGCYHFSPLAGEEYLSIKEYENDVRRLSKLFEGKMERIMLLGGEPLLHPSICDFFRVTREYFPIGRIQILTNGILLLQMHDIFFYAMREYNVELWVTKYPINFNYDRAEELALHYDIKLNYFSNEPVRTLGHQPLDITGGQDWVENFNHCYRANECIDLKHGKMFSCIIPAEIKPFCEYFKLDIPVTEHDYVDIYKVNSAEELLEKLGCPIPFCRYCNRDSIEVFGVSPWEKTKYKLEEWTE